MTLGRFAFRVVKNTCKKIYCCRKGEGRVVDIGSL